jgi:hypothetical protein
VSGRCGCQHPMSPHSAPVYEALEALGVIVGYAGGWMPVYRTREGRVRVFWRESRRPGLGSTIRALDEAYGDQITLGLPEARRFNGGVGSCTVLWSRVQGPDQLRRANAFRPRPTMVLADGRSSRLCLWWLERPVSYFVARDANRKIAYCLRAVQKWGDPDALRIPCPGSCVTEGRARPLMVRVSRLTTASFVPDMVVGRLREPPPKDAWREANGGFR